MKEAGIAFTVVIPVYNRADILGRAVHSVLAQTCQDFEIIVVDDGSRDDVGAAVEKFGDARIVYIRQQNQGASTARNRGIDAARGRFVAFLDSDDSYLPHHLATAAHVLSGAENMAFYSPVIAERAAGISVVKPPRRIRAGEDMACYLMCDRGFVQTSGLVVPRHIARRVRYREDASFGDDTDFAVRLQRAGCTFSMADTPSVIWSDGNALPRLSSAGTSVEGLAWLDDLKEVIPLAAYNGYRGWHLAKALFRTHPFLAARLYLRAVSAGSYSCSLAVIVLCQIVFPSALYRNLANAAIKAGSIFRKVSHGV